MDVKVPGKFLQKKGKGDWLLGRLMLGHNWVNADIQEVHLICLEFSYWGKLIFWAILSHGYIIIKEMGVWLNDENAGIQEQESLIQMELEKGSLYNYSDKLFG